MKQIGIYKITNKINNNYYIGSSIDIQDRWRKHISATKNNSKYPIHRAIRKYGLENFTFEVLELCEETDLLHKEQVLLNENVGKKECYNASKDVYAPMRGRKHTKKTKKQISNKKKNISDSVRFLLGASWRGKRQPNSMVEKRVNSIRGRKYSTEHKQKLSIAAKERYNNEGTDYPTLVNVTTGKIIPSGKNVRRMCKENNLPHIQVGALLSGHRKTSYGWRIL